MTRVEVKEWLDRLPRPPAFGSSGGVCNGHRVTKRDDGKFSVDRVVYPLLSDATDAILRDVPSP